MLGLPGAPWARAGAGFDAEFLGQLLARIEPDLVILDVAPELIESPEHWSATLGERPDAEALLGPLRARFEYEALSAGDSATEFAVDRASWSAAHRVGRDHERERARTIERDLQMRHGDDGEWWLGPEASQATRRRWTVWMREADEDLGNAALSKSLERDYNSVAELLRANPGKRVLVAFRVARAWSVSLRLRERRPGNVFVFDPRTFAP